MPDSSYDIYISQEAQEIPLEGTGIMDDKNTISLK